jgi:chaperonin GroEL
LRQIALNSGLEPEKLIFHIQDEKKDVNFGYDFSIVDLSNPAAGEGNMFEKGIVDPLKVTRLALENAVSIVSTLVTTEAIIVDKPEPKEAAAPAGGMGGGMGGMGGMY